MITMQEWMELVKYKISEGGMYGWECYGYNAYFLDSRSSYDVMYNKGYNFTIIFDTATQEVYEVQAHDFLHNRAYRMINPGLLELIKNESIGRGTNHNEAWEGVDYVDLEVDDDFIQKCLAIASGEEYDTRVTVPLDLTDSEMMTLFKMAHEADKTFNDFVTDVLIAALEEKKFIVNSEELDEDYK